MRPLSLLVWVCSVGCSAIIEPNIDRLGDGGQIVIDIDGGASDSGPGFDAGPGLDAGPFDAGMGGCGPDRSECQGETRVRCARGVETRVDCAAGGAFCEGGECHMQVCEPGSRNCEGNELIICDARGASETSMGCEIACDDLTGTCIGMPDMCEGLGRVIVGGTVRVDLCSESDDNTYVPGGQCGADTRANTGDRVLALTIERPMRVTIDLRDVDGMVGIDTVVYLRRVCDQESSQIACSDDIPCSESDIMSGCSDGFQVRQSRITITLEPGTYYVVVDAFEYGGFDCGFVDLRVSEAGP